MENSLDLNFNEIVNMIETRRNNAYKKVNEELISLYWDFGKYISEKVNDSNWGDKIVDKLVEFMKREYPTMKGFNRRGIYRMKQFYETYKDNEFVSTLLTQISWSNNVIILSSTNSMEEKEFYIRMCIKNNYTARELDRQISSGYYQRYMLSDGKANQSLTKAVGEEDYPNTRILDTYSLEFLDLPNQYSEKDLKKAIISNMKDFILEIGKDFTYVGDEYRVQVGDEDFYIDLLFYNRSLSCLVAFELKTDKFKPEYISKMDFYLETLDRQEKKENENPSVGVILCTSKNEKVVEYAMSRTLSPTMVSQYTLNLIDKKLLENKLKEIADMVEENNEKM
jgi:predicted nuclease of restriction endonuclease-like (RecB) superfamily